MNKSRCGILNWTMSSRLAAVASLEKFEEHAKPGKVALIDSKGIDDFIRKRRNDKGRLEKYVSPATVNKDLRYIKAALSVAHDWGMLDRVPKICFLKLPQKLKTFVPQEHFAAIYTATEHARFPEDVPTSRRLTGGRRYL